MNGILVLVLAWNEMMKNSGTFLLKKCLDRDYNRLVTIQIETLKDFQVVAFAIDV